MRLLTRSDFDGLVCAVLLVEASVVNEYKFVHPIDIHEGKYEITANDVLANIPYVAGCGLWFDHHYSEMERLKLYSSCKYNGKSELAPSCARVIYDYYGGAARFSRFEQSGMMASVDKCDSGHLTREDIMNPSGWVLLSFIMDPRTGLGRYKDYRISNYQLMEALIEYCRTKNVADVLQIPDVSERVQRYFQQEKEYENMLKTHSCIDGNVLVIDLLNVDPILAGNRFKEYVLFPKPNVSIRLIWGQNRQNVVLTCGHSILNETLKANIGALMLKYGGGGHPTVGTCQVPVADYLQVKNELIAALKEG
jgi:nanoRNase/pAp phosphatase (c-di-AMP/oligoRNAs hydrolase)